MNSSFDDTTIRMSLAAAGRSREVVRAFDFLFGANLAARSSPGQLSAEGADTRLEADAEDFVDFMTEIMAARGRARVPVATDPHETQWGGGRTIQ